MVNAKWVTLKGSSVLSHCKKGASSPSLPTWMTLCLKVIQKRRYSSNVTMPGVSSSALSGLVWLNRMADLVFFHPPMNTSTMGSAIESLPSNETWASLWHLTSKVNVSRPRPLPWMGRMRYSLSSSV